MNVIFFCDLIEKNGIYPRSHNTIDRHYDFLHIKDKIKITELKKLRIVGVFIFLISLIVVRDQCKHFLHVNQLRITISI